MASEIQLYGTDWCGLTYSLREYLTNARLAYDFYDVDRDQEACALMLAITDGRRRFPIVIVCERVLANPTRAELQSVLDEYGIRPAVARRRHELAALGKTRSGESRDR